MNLTVCCFKLFSKFPGKDAMKHLMHEQSLLRQQVFHLVFNPLPGHSPVCAGTRYQLYMTSQGIPVLHSPMVLSQTELVLLHRCLFQQLKFLRENSQM